MMGLGSRRARHPRGFVAWWLFFLASSGVLLSPVPAGAQTAEPVQEQIGGGEPVDPNAEAPKIAVATAYVGVDIHVDGRLDEPAWRTASWITDFRQKDPEIGASPTQRSEVTFAYDEEALYIAGRMLDTEPDRIQDLVTRRDQGGRTDIILFSFDTYGDRTTAYTFAVTAAGSRSDWFHPRDREYDRDYTFNPVWQAETRRDSLGWTVEARIPFSQLRFNRGVDEWGLNINRYLPDRQEDLYWVVIPREEPGWSSQMGRLTGLSGVEPRRRFEISPYVSADLELTSSQLVDPSDPFSSTSEAAGRVGADIKYGLGPNLTLDATVNPDFGQVEADPAIVNLTAFETFFPERRPFFTEGSNLLGASGDLPGYYYSRRIGASPHGPAGGDFAEIPQVTTILGAAKLTGRMGSGLSVGALGALTAPEDARIYDLATGTYDERRVEPTTGWGVLRLQQEIGANASTVGFMGTAVTRSFTSDDPTRDILATGAFTGGGDFNLRLDGGAYEVRGHAGLSYLSGSTEAIATVQRSSAHYFQRPDQDHVTYDPTRTSLLGFTGSLQVEKTGGEHWLWNAGVWGDTPDLELNDLGRLGRADDLQAWGGLTYRETEPGDLFRNYSIRLNGGSGWNFGGIRTGTYANLNGNAQFSNYWSAGLGFSQNLESQNDRLTRGGPLMGRSSYQSVNAQVSNSYNADVRLSLYGFWGNLYEGDDYSVGLDVSFEPSDQLRVSFGPEYSRNTNRRQYYTTRDGPEDRTYGTRYVFSTIEQSEISFPVRMNYAFHPDLSLELWAQPFAASGRFTAFGELPEARSYDLRLYGTDGTTITEEVDPVSGTRTYHVTDGADEFTLPDANFNALSFRSNLVMRWELRPGSTLYLVWQQNLSEGANTGDFVRPGALFDSFGAPGSNVLAVKMSYWLPM